MLGEPKRAGKWRGKSEPDLPQHRDPEAILGPSEAAPATVTYSPAEESINGRVIDAEANEGIQR